MKNTKSIDLRDIETIIKEGAKKAYRDNLFLTGNYTDFQSRMIESLVVITIAQKLLDWAFTNNCQIQLEYPIKDFYNGAFPDIIWTQREVFDPSKFIKRQNHNPIKVNCEGIEDVKLKENKSGRIDIAITTEPSSGKEGAFFINPKLKSLIGIEIKAINKSASDIENDFIRMANAVSLEDRISPNGILSCYCLFYRRLDNPKQITSEEEIEGLKVKDQEKWTGKFNELLKSTPTVKYDLEPIVISEGAVDGLSDYYPPEEFDASDIAEMTGLVVCYLMKIYQHED
ncbi:MAG: hypothetical protein WBP58_17765 [Chitinophagaceae bacterium]